MPTYDYICDNCGHEFDAFESIKSEPQLTCPACKENRLRRKIGAGAAILFKGSGFYQTDYRSESYKKRAQSEKPSEGSSKTDGAKTDSAKSESQPKAESPKASSNGSAT
jgi:putative FmdB family regulatory protein